MNLGGENPYKTPKSDVSDKSSAEGNTGNSRLSDMSEDEIKKNKQIIIRYKIARNCISSNCPCIDWAYL